MSEVRKERTYWRDEGISQRHREWGENVPAIDLDFVLCEFDRYVPVAIIEYKGENAAQCTSETPGVRVLVNLGEKAQLPCFLVRYANDLTWYKVVPLNKSAEEVTGRATLSEKEYVHFLYKIRNRVMPEGLRS